MDISWIITFVLALSLSATSHQDYSDDEAVWPREDVSCQLDNGEQGLCRFIEHCPTAEDQIWHEGYRDDCARIGGRPVVCCTHVPTWPRRPTTWRPSVVREPTRRPWRPEPHAVQRTPGISWDKCTEYASSGQKVSSPAFSGGQEVSAQYPCSQSIQQLIVNGILAAPKEFPHMVALGFGADDDIQWLCGGSLISDRYILTVAHCFFSKGRGWVRWARLGDLNLYDAADAADADDAGPETVEIVERFPHPQYRPPAKYNDIGLLRLARSVQFTAYLRPACLHTNSSTPEGDTAIATGWGKVEFDAETGSKELMKVDLRIHKAEDCVKAYQQLITTGSQLTRGFDEESMICAGDSLSMRDTCGGDSGGPLQVRLEHHCMYSIVGLTSFGVSACGVSNTPGFYTRVSHFVPWIEAVVWPDED